ncbi:MAG: hypothetical protein KIG24_05775 [Oscillospiraceae bacterium]|nr:hypothetical protein [Oscillospiraceae bacterium]
MFTGQDKNGTDVTRIVVLEQKHAARGISPTGCSSIAPAKLAKYETSVILRNSVTKNP